MKKIVSFIVLIILLSAFVEKRENKMRSFSWMVGSWSMKTNRGAIMETWTTVNDSTMGGESVMIKNAGEKQQLENIRLVYRNNEYYYCPTAHGQNNEQEVKFRITSYSENGFVAENPQHDFPKRITYRLVNKDSVHAFVDGGPSMPNKKSDFYYSRFKK